MKIQNSKKNFYLLVILLPVISWIFLAVLFGNNFKKFNEIALGENNIPVKGKILDQNILCDSAESIKNCINFLKKNFKKKIIWIGNSQLYGVNQGSINSKTAPHRASEYFFEKEVGLITFAAPNISFQEYLEVVKYLSENLELDIVILSLVFDDTREDGVRKNLIIKENKQNIKTKNLQEFFEDSIIRFLNTSINWTSIRSQAQGTIYEFLYKSRNNLFGIKATSVRKSIKPIYDKNLSALNKTIDELTNKKIEIVMYIAPIRHDINLPYNIKEYSSYKNSLKIKAKKTFSHFYNLEKIVPGKFWGEKRGSKLGVKNEVDFMHFQEEGHKILAAEIIKILEDIIK